MNAEECELAYRQLLSMLEYPQFGWVVEQLEVGIIAGEIELPKNKNKSPTIIEDFSAHKKLRYLVDAIEQAVINTADMEREIISFFRTEIAFYPDSENSEESFSINETSLTSRRQDAISVLQELLNLLRARISEDDSE
ncbi:MULTISPECIES: hypothetical protein [Nostoc]|uniref:Uncharacterized protein n=1 Tax=Nostoc paludosum FACHB-159 TaxID=2692908 RepID=A0ABR8K6T1_9NOSO|nr:MULTISPECIES: hypothetical protein [Nostoc]MBD2678474.1 hypothetical protein [Nostoc sp. FACHB-857]MBD2734519.1 hypothetical protein [Nostoc paludosum FACHB-159]